MNFMGITGKLACHCVTKIIEKFAHQTEVGTFRETIYIARERETKRYNNRQNASYESKKKTDY